MRARYRRVLDTCAGAVSFASSLRLRQGVGMDPRLAGSVPVMPALVLTGPLADWHCHALSVWDRRSPVNVWERRSPVKVSRGNGHPSSSWVTESDWCVPSLYPVNDGAGIYATGYLQTGTFRALVSEPSTPTAATPDTNRIDNVLRGNFGA
jgi:hypothetical protein